MAIDKTKAGTYAVDFRGVECNCGKIQGQHRHRIQKTFRTHREAVGFEKEVIAQVAKGEHLLPSKRRFERSLRSGINARPLPVLTVDQPFTGGRTI